MEDDLIFLLTQLVCFTALSLISSLCNPCCILTLLSAALFLHVMPFELCARHF